MLSIFQQVGTASLHSPLCSQGMTNHVLNFGLFFETFCAALILYLPYSYLVNLYPVAPEWWLSALPFSLLIWGSDEVTSGRRPGTRPSPAPALLRPAGAPAGHSARGLPLHGDLLLATCTQYSPPVAIYMCASREKLIYITCSSVDTNVVDP
jgi:hypothetical protein